MSLKVCGYCGSKPMRVVDSWQDGGINYTTHTIICGNADCEFQPATHALSDVEEAYSDWQNSDVYKTKNREVVIQ